jgi:hypothetical protein
MSFEWDGAEEVGLWKYWLLPMFAYLKFPFTRELYRQMQVVHTRFDRNGKPTVISRHRLIRKVRL